MADLYEAAARRARARDQPIRHRLFTTRVRTVLHQFPRALRDGGTAPRYP
ncbi:hypothetical protein AB0O01_00470 [Streptomyces sp. NPDC093252]